MRAEDVCRRAADLVGGDRARQHGSKTKNFENAAALWNAYLAIRPEPAAPLNATDHALMMVLLKVARTQLGAFNADDFVDMAGYAACAGEVERDRIDAQWVKAALDHAMEE